MPSKKLTKAEQYAKIPIERIGMLQGEEGMKTLRNYVKTMRMGYNRRVQQFKRAGLFSYAQDTFERSYPKTRPVQLTKLNRNQLILEFARYQKFYNSETATVKGIKKINREQDQRIFGTKGKRRNPIDTMTEEQRKNFWRLYDQFKAQQASTFAIYGSDRTQKFMGAMKIGDDLNLDFDWNNANIVQMIAEMDEAMNYQYAEELIEESTPNALSGLGDDLKKKLFG